MVHLNAVKIITWLSVTLIAALFCGQDYSNNLNVEKLKQYQADVKRNPNAKLVEIKRYIPGILLDIRYATSNNFMHRPMYQSAGAFARRPVVMALKDVEADLKTRGLGLKIYDAYRPYNVTVKFYQMTPDTNFVADPRKGSKHNRGCAIDLSLIDLKTGKELDMPTGFDSFSKAAAANYQGLPKSKIANRELLKKVMQAHGFKVIATEWWHYDFNGWQQYPLLDIPFNKL